MTNFEKVDKLVKHLAEKLKELETYKVTALSVEENGVKVEVRRDTAMPAATFVRHDAVPTSKEHENKHLPQNKEEEGLIAITSPMVGTFYRAASPESPAFVEGGSVVDVGQTVCIIEAMKLFNEIESEVKGRVVKILVENAQPVEYGQKLILIKPE